jgi:hypothetical protein
MQAFFEGRSFVFSREQDRHDLEAFMMAFGPGPHAGIGAQGTLRDPEAEPERSRLEVLRAAADQGGIGLVMRGRDVFGVCRAWLYGGDGTWLSDRSAEPALPHDDLVEMAGRGRPFTYTAVPREWARRLALDRDGDGALDRDEVDAGSDPADPASTPGSIQDGPTPSAQLSAVFPNPLSSETATVAFRLDAPGPVRVTVHDLQGRRVALLADEQDRPAGAGLATWNRTDGSGRQVGSGVYFVRLVAGDSALSQRVVVLPR